MKILEFKTRQEYRVNRKYEILTPNGWEDFGGVIKNFTPKNGRKISLDNGLAITATLDHIFYINGVAIKTGELSIGDVLDGIVNRVIMHLEDTVLQESYDIHNTQSHQVIAETLHSHNCDEFDVIAPNKQKEFTTAIFPVLSTGGDFIITSTPKSEDSEFGQIWKNANTKTDEHGNPTDPEGPGRNHFFPSFAPWWVNPERDEAWAQPFRESLGEAKFRQEFCCEFVTDDETLINIMAIQRMVPMMPEFYTEQVRWYMDPQPNRHFMVALDPSLGTGGDYAAIQVFQLPEMIQIAEWQHNKTDPKGQVMVLMQILLFIDDVLRNDPNQINEPDIYWTFENNTIGEAILQIVDHTGEEKFPGNLVNERKKRGQTKRFRKGLNTVNRNKMNACARLKMLAERDQIKLNSDNLIKELKTFVRYEKTCAAKTGTHDDLVMAVLLIVRMLDNIIASGLDIDDLKDTITDSDLDGDDGEPMPMIF